MTRLTLSVGLLALAASMTVAAAPSDDAQYKEGSAAFHMGERARALKILKPLAEQGRADAQQKVAVIYLGGSGVARDNKQATMWYAKAAEGGNADAQHQLATAYREGLYDLPKDHQLALKWFRAAAGQGHARSQLSLAVMYENGWGTEKNPGEAFRLAQLAADQGNADAQMYLGNMYEKGEAVGQDNIKAAKWYQSAADKGSYMGKSYLKSLLAKDPAITVTKVTPVTSASVAASQQALPQKPLEQPKPAAPVLSATPTSSPAVAPTPPVTTVSDNSFDLDKAPASERGKAIPIAGNPAYGSKFTDANGLYTFILASNWSWERDSNDSRATHFWGTSGSNHASCVVAPMDYWRGAKSFGELQAIPESKAMDSFEKGLMETLGWNKVEQRGTLTLGDGGWPKRTPVKALSWGAANGNGSYDTAVVIEAPANALLAVCNSNRPKTGENVIKLAFRVAEGALTPARDVPSARFALGSDSGKQDSIRKMVAADRSGRTWIQRNPASAGNQATEREKLQREFDGALARNDRDTIYRIGPKIKDVKFCQYVDRDPSATPQQIYDGASSCPSGPLFDRMTKRYINASTPLTQYSNGTGSSAPAAYSATTNSAPQVNWTQYNLQVQRSTDAAIRDMNRRIDDAGR